MKRVATALLVLVVTASIAPSAVAGTTASKMTKQTPGEAYAGTHVSFDAESKAVTDYAVHGETMLDSVRVQSASEVEDGGLADIGASLSAVTEIEGAGLSLGATTTTEARVSAEGSATITAHDNGHGVLVVAAGDQSDYVVADLPSGAEASAESDAQVAVTTENGTEGTLLVVGEGNVTVNDEDDVTARLGDDARLVLRSYPEGKDDGDEKQEDLLVQGEAKAEAYVMVENGSDASESADDDERVVVDTISYGENTTVETTESAEDEVTLAVNRTTHEGTILVTSVSEQALNATEGLEVAVDGESAVEARTYSQLRSAVGSDQSRYVVESAGSASASASADVLIAVNHFSERTVSMRSASASETTTQADDTTAGESDQTTQSGASSETTQAGASDETTSESAETSVVDDETDNGAGVPGFTVTATVVALLGAALLARRR
ncbi:PGF-CTERM sorting domain-containing protein [Halorussus lipolyticus]|uniref:PGF-CTERM sorting domain-containing protein n=1 Tax=Halorussus lipolyticus TaxID=3034024 RepID=UPI0023E8E331|nr:PGF-CTERM sorting domain-containing protein [Halorussus sp. DT80]